MAETEGTQLQSLDGEDPLEEEIQWTEEPAAAAAANSLQSCPTLRDPMDCSLPGSSVCGILQAKILEWVAMPSSRGSFQPRDRTHDCYVSCLGRQVLNP